MTPSDPTVRGAVVDDQTRCVHYAGPDDVVAFRFPCCDDWYPCIRCHAESTDHAAQTWPVDRHGVHAVLCGVCRSRLSITAYLTASACPRCVAAFNPRCRLHHHLYFELPTAPSR